MKEYTEDIAAKLIDGKKVSLSIQEELKKQVEEVKSNGGKIPHLCAILVGNDGGSETYVAAKIKACENIGFKSSMVRFADTVTEEELIKKVDEINKDTDVDGLIVQLPLPKHIDVDKVTNYIKPEKDVDGFHPVNLGKLLLGLDTYVSATPFGIMQLLKFYQIDTVGKHCVVIGRSNIVGTPVSILMSRNTNPGNATVTLCHSKTKNLKEITLQADIIIAAIGIPEFLKGDMVKEGAVIIDVGTTRVDAPDTKSGWRLKGDVDFNEVAPKASFITPVPGGVGPMTIAGLLANTMKSAKKEIYK
jgi:methylenetetrahydrofolate dehydrogenase (NADP+) / methenyltetrahydrofolate cyclohydrolase